MSKLRFIMVLPVVILVLFTLAAGQVMGRRGDINADGSLDIHDIVAELDWMRSSGVPPAADLTADGKVNIFDMLELLLQMRWLGESGDGEFRAAVTINEHEMDEPYVFIYRPVEWWEFPGRNYNGPLSGQYNVYANRGIERVEFILDGDTLRELSGITPVLAVMDSTGQGDTVVPMFFDEFVVSKPKTWQLKVWASGGDVFVDSGQTRFAIVNGYCVDCGGSPKVGLPLEFPLVMHGQWQRFALEHPDFTDLNSLLKIDLNPAGADSVVFGDMDQLVEAIMEQIVVSLQVWSASSEALLDLGGPYATAAVSKHTDIKTDRLLFYLHRIGGSDANLVLLDGNERLLSALGFPRWWREAGYGILNINYKKDPVIYEKYKDQID